MKPLVSILIPCYNAGRFVAATLQSVLGQTWPSKEIIVVDDGSTDGSGGILEGFKAKGVRVIHQANQGQGAAANRAFHESTGEFIKFFDADDLLKPETIELQMARSAGGAGAMVLGEVGEFYGGDLSTFRLRPERVWRDMDPAEYLIESWQSGRVCGAPVWLIPRSLLNERGLWNERLSLESDYEFMARLLCHASEVRFAAGARLYYRTGNCRSLSMQTGEQFIESAVKSRLLATKHLLARRNDARACRACADFLQHLIFKYYPGEARFRSTLAARIKELGGSNLQPRGGPRFQTMRRFVGWQLALRLQGAAGRRVK